MLHDVNYQVHVYVQEYDKVVNSRYYGQVKMNQIFFTVINHFEASS